MGDSVLTAMYIYCACVKCLGLLSMDMILPAGLMLLVPYTPTLLTDYFAGARAGHPVKCTDLAAGVQPPAACKSAHDDVVQWNAKKSFICNIFLGVILTPLLSRWSDYYGRKPFMIYGKLTGILPTFTVLAYLKFGLPLWW